MKHIIFLDGKYIKVNDKILEVFTPGVFRGRGVFETMLGLDGEILDVALHLARLRRGLKALKMKLPSIHPSVLKEVLHRNHLPCARVRLMVWLEGQQTHVMIAALSYKNSDQKEYRVCLFKTDRAANDRLADVKSLDYGLFALAFAQAQAQGFDEALLLNRRNYIFEASRANIFWIKDRILFTPPLSSGCLKGITRGQILREARRLKVPVKERNLTPDMLTKADAAFLTNSLIGIKPIALVKSKRLRLHGRHGS